MARLARCLRRALPAVLLFAAAGCTREFPDTPACAERQFLVSPAAITVGVAQTSFAEGLETRCQVYRGVRWRTEDTSIALLVGPGDSATFGAEVLGVRPGTTRLTGTAIEDPPRTAMAGVTVVPTYFPVTDLSVEGTIEFGGRVVARGDTLRGTLLLSNPGKDPAFVQSPACSIGIRAYADSARTEPTPWRMGWTRLPSAPLWAIELGVVCDVGPSPKRIPAGATDSVVTVARQGDWMPVLPPGHYYWFALVIRPDSSLRWIPAGEGDVP